MIAIRYLASVALYVTLVFTINTFDSFGDDL